ncbi:hypothetical protein Val02_18730 [Virgisporangium aliadipatigenens]|uniref:Uncharacterized protein n=1 Tax=Virgisporangium aliadipatigenens TaxID=741659 RepID=A0A8J3YIE2_9ACTN|nr:hypothetical protein Val02_18730 [Virgisporangium aliadipatigenens]
MRATDAHAASGCTGSLIEKQTATRNAQAIFELQVYYNSSTGMNCAVALHRGVTYGKAYPTQVYIIACVETSPSNQCRTRTLVADPPSADVSKYGNWSYLAGPVSVYGRGRCIHAEADMRYDALGPHLATAGAATHCG